MTASTDGSAATPRTGRSRSSAPRQARDAGGGLGERWTVWLVTDVYPPDCGGSGWSCHALARTLCARGHRVEVVAVDPAGLGSSQRLFEGVRITEVGLRRARRSIRRRLGADDYALEALSGYLERRIREEARTGTAPQVVHGQHLHSGPAAVRAARRTGGAAVVTVRDYWPVCLHGTAWWGRRRCRGCSSTNLIGCLGEYWGWPAALAAPMIPWARRRVAARVGWLRRAHRVTAVSSAVSRRVGSGVEAVARSGVADVDRIGGVDGADAGAMPRIDVVPNIVDPDYARSRAAVVDGDRGHEEGTGSAPPAPAGVPAERPYLLAAGKLVPTKGFDRLLEAMGERGETPRWPLVVAGRGPQEAELRRLAAALDLPVRFVGWVDHDALLALARDAVAVLLPSAWEEPLSRSLLEAMALGVPVVAWDTGGSAEAVEHGVEGWLVRRPEDLAEALSRLADDDERRRAGSAARRTVLERFSPAAVYPRIAAVYGAAVAEAAS